MIDMQANGNGVDSIMCIALELPVVQVGRIVRSDTLGMNLELTAKETAISDPKRSYSRQSAVGSPNGVLRVQKDPRKVQAIARAVSG